MSSEISVDVDSGDGITGKFLIVVQEQDLGYIEYERVEATSESTTNEGE